MFLYDKINTKTSSMTITYFTSLIKQKIANTPAQNLWLKIFRLTHIFNNRSIVNRLLTPVSGNNSIKVEYYTPDVDIRCN